MFGMLINAIPLFSVSLEKHSMNHMNWFPIISAIVLYIICAYAIFNKFTGRNSINKTSKHANLSIIVKGMTCNHCKETVMEAINESNGIDNVQIDVKSGQTLIYGHNIDEEKIIASINKVGFSVGKNT